MISKVPLKFNFNDSTEGVFLFYQCISELTFDFSRESFKVPMHSIRSLCSELIQACEVSRDVGHDSDFMKKHVKSIMGELAHDLSVDAISKKILKKHHSVFHAFFKNSDTFNNKSWIDIVITHSRLLKSKITNKKYLETARDTLIPLIREGKEKKEIVNLTRFYICELAKIFSLQHINAVAEDIFRNRKVDSIDSVVSFFEHFPRKSQEWILYAIADKRLFDYYNDKLQQMISTEEFSIAMIDAIGFRKSMSSRDYNTYKWFDSLYKNKSSFDNSLVMIEIKAKHIDPYKAIELVTGWVKVLYSFIALLDHEHKIMHDEVLCSNYPFASHLIVRHFSMLTSRKKSDDFGKRLVRFFENNAMSHDVFFTIIQALNLHNEAISKSTNMGNSLLDCWIALEMLFKNARSSSSKENQVESGLLEIIQRTHIIKILSYIQGDLLEFLNLNRQKELVEKYKLDDIKCFIDFLFSDNTGIDNVLSSSLKANPLLRTRINQLKYDALHDGDGIMRTLDEHRQKIVWQIQRIYRARNYIAHQGKYNVSGLSYLLENLHAYFDFVVNFLICKGEFRESVVDIRDTVQEVAYENKIHLDILKTAKKEKTSANALEMLLGEPEPLLTYYQSNPIR